MRGRVVILVTALTVVAATPESVSAQFFPGGLIGALTSPLRGMLGHFGRGSRLHRHLSAATPAEAAPPTGATTRPNLGLVGPMAWPTAYTDILGYALWPSEYGEQFNSHGFDVISDTLTSGGTPGGREPARMATTGSASAIGVGDPCRGRGDAPNGWPTARIQQTIQLSDAQQNALETLRRAVTDSVNTIRAGCRDTGSMSPSERLSELAQRLWTVRDAGLSVRAPLQDFYGTLTDTQKASFEVRQPDPQAMKATTTGMGNPVQACAAQIAADSDGLMRQIEEKVAPSNGQRVGLGGLRNAVSNMAKLLSAACAKPVPSDPLARLDAANDQLATINYAAATVQVSLNGFYAGLSADQKARFNALGH